MKKDALQFNFSHLGCPLGENKKLDAFITTLSTGRPASYAHAIDALWLPFDPAITREVKNIKQKKVSGTLAHGFIVGIGGSSLGARAVYEALHDASSCQLTFLDTADADVLHHAKKTITECKRKEDFLIVLVSKSGTTTESIANFEILYASAQEKFGDASDRVVVVTDSQSLLWQKAQEKKFSVLSIPEAVDGRFSVFSSAGLLPLAVAGIDVDGLTKGARDIAEDCSVVSKHNPAYVWASAQAYHYAQGTTTHNTFFFSPPCEGLGKWFRELLGESLNKTTQEKDKEIRTSITPIVSVGSIDLHAMIPRFIDGAHDIFTTFVRAFSASDDVVIPQNTTFEESAEKFKGKSAQEIMEVLYKGTIEEYEKHKLPFGEVSMNQINEYAIGAWMQWRMFEVVYLGVLLGVDPFSEPAVRGYKENVEELLG